MCSSKDDCDKCSLRVCADVTYCTTDTQVSRLGQFVSSVLLGCSTRRYNDSHLFNILLPTSHHCHTHVYTCQAHPKLFKCSDSDRNIGKGEIAFYRHLLNDDIVICIAVKHTRIWPSFTAHSLLCPPGLLFLHFDVELFFLQICFAQSKSNAVRDKLK